MILQQLGIRSTTLSRFKSYLHERPQAVNINGMLSNIKELLCGVLQWSTLGPLLFIVYSHSLRQLLREQGVNYHLFDDDSQIYIHAL